MRKLTQRTRRGLSFFNPQLTDVEPSHSTCISSFFLEYDRNDPGPRRRFQRLPREATPSLDFTSNPSNHSLERNDMILQPAPDTIRTSYITNSTIHGLGKIFTGVWWERIVWLVALCICIGVIGHFTTGFYADYRKHDVRTEIRMHTAKNVPYPAITICKGSPLNMVLCYKNVTVFGLPCNTGKQEYLD